MTSELIDYQPGGVSLPKQDHSQPLSQVLTDGTGHASLVTHSVATDYFDVTGWGGLRIGVVNGADNAVTFTVETSDDASNWVTLAYGDMKPASGAAVPTYTVAARTLAASGTTSLKLPMADVGRYVRVNVSSANATGTTFTLTGRP